MSGREREAWEAYKKTKTQAQKVLDEVTAQAWEAYQKTTVQAQEAYEKVGCAAGPSSSVRSRSSR
jgi:hypothetical protein